MKKFLIIAAVVVVIVIVALIVIFATKGKQMMELAIDKGFPVMENLMVANRPASVPEDSIHTIFDATIEKIRSGEADPKVTGALMMKFRDFMGDKKLDSLEVITILEEMGKL